MGERKTLHGHGVRQRQALGPLEPGLRPCEGSIFARRYRCISCGAVLMVVPSGVLLRRRYTAMAIGYAVALFGIAGLSAAEVRRRISIWGVVGAAAAPTWESLRRWLRAIRRGDLFPFVRECPPGWTLREVATRAAATLAAHAVPTPTSPSSVETQAFEGAMRMS